MTTEGGNTFVANKGSCYFFVMQEKKLFSIIKIAFTKRGQ